MREKLKKAKAPFLISFLFCFMWLIFGPAEIFFANVVEFQFIYQEFGFYMIILALILSVVMMVIGVVLPDKIRRVYLSVILGVSIAGYLQIMFFNQKLDLLGLNPDGYHVTMGHSALNLILWLVIIAIVITLAFQRHEVWKKAVLYISVFLLAVQGVAYISLLVTAKDEAFQYPERGYHLTGENQFQVSAEKNVIVIILDYFSNEYLDEMNEVYPDATDFLHDFTYYSNYDCNYFGTYPSLLHMFTGCEVDMSLTVNEWTKEIWNNDVVCKFYDTLHKDNYLVNFYTPDDHILCGMNGLQILDGKFDNISDEELSYNVYNTLLIKTMMKMSAYRMAPERLKSWFYTRSDEYGDVVRSLDPEMEVTDHQANFFVGLQNNGLTIDEEHNYFIVQHFAGTHELTTDENGRYTTESTFAKTAKGCMVIVEAYLNELKKLGVYDNSTIIITADHGDKLLPQVIFYMKEPGESHESSPINTAPVSHNEFFPTIAKAAGIEDDHFGPTVQDILEDEPRERTYWLRAFDSGYPTVPCYTGDKDGIANVYYGYTYVGNREDLLKQFEVDPDQIVPFVDSYF